MTEEQPTIELWALIPRTTGRYEISDAGRVRNIATGRVLSAYRNRANYRYVAILGVRRAIHRMVLEAFVGDRPGSFDACHANGLRDDNRLANLRWDTRAGNMADMDPVTRRNATEAARLVNRGEGSHLAKLTEADVIEVRRLWACGVPRQGLARMYGVTKSAIAHIVQHRSWKHLP